MSNMSEQPMEGGADILAIQLYEDNHHIEANPYNNNNNFRAQHDTNKEEINNNNDCYPSLISPEITKTTSWFNVENS